MSVKQIESHDLVTDPAQAPAPESTTPRRRQLGRYALGVLILAGGLGGAALLAPAAAPPMLTDADLKYLQDAEHFGGFVLGNRTLPLLAGALKDGDAEAAKSFLADSFQGHLFAEDAGELTTYAFATFRRFDEDDGAAEPLDRDGFVETLLAYRAEFDERANVSLKVMQMQPVTYGELEGPWQGSLKLRLAGTRVEGGLAERVIRFRCSITGIDDDTPEAYGWLASCTEDHLPRHRVPLRSRQQRRRPQRLCLGHHRRRTPRAVREAGRGRSTGRLRERVPRRSLAEDFTARHRQQPAGDRCQGGV